MRTEYYVCDICGKEFQVTEKERMATFTLMRPKNWTCPKCGFLCVANYVKDEEKE